MVLNIFVTAATGQLGRLVVDNLLSGADRDQIQITAGVRDPGKAPQEWSQSGVTVVQSDYTSSADDWAQILEGQDRVLLISSSTGVNNGRVQQHKNVIDGAKKANVKMLAYTSAINADRNKMILANDHRETEALLTRSGLNFLFLRNGWYTENFFATAANWKSTNTLFSAAGDAKYSVAPRADFAEAAAVVLRPSFRLSTKNIYELAGDEAVTLDQFAAVASPSMGYRLKHKSLSQEECFKTLTKNGFPEVYARYFADADYNAAQEDILFNDSKDLSTLIGRPTQPLDDFVSSFLAKEKKSIRCT